jgi:hypothetical protein
MCHSTLVVSFHLSLGKVFRGLLTLFSEFGIDRSIPLTLERISYIVNPLLVLHESFWMLDKELELKVLQSTTHHLFSTLEVFPTTFIFLEQLGFRVSVVAEDLVVVAEL